MRKSKRFLAMGVAFAMSIATVTGLMVPTAEAVVPLDRASPSRPAICRSSSNRSRSPSSTRQPSTPPEPVRAPWSDPRPADQTRRFRLTDAYGLRTVDGSCNNLFAGRENFAAADQPFPRLTNPFPRRGRPLDSFPVGVSPETDQLQAEDSPATSSSTRSPATISNLIVDQTSTNPAAIAAAEFPVRTQGNPGLHPCTTDPDPTATPTRRSAVPAGCVPSHQTLFIPNVTTDVGLSPPYNSLFTFFGQFFDHGVDQTVKSGGTVFVPLKADDPLVTLGPDGKAGTGDEVPASQAFMVLTRAQNQPGPDGILGTADDVQDANNTDTPWVDQSQTYTSHASHQVFLREYCDGRAQPPRLDRQAARRPASAGQTYTGLAGRHTTASAPGRRSRSRPPRSSGCCCVDKDVTNIPMLATDPTASSSRAARGLPQYVTATGSRRGQPGQPGAGAGQRLHFDTPFLTDIAHNADPSPQDTDNNPAPRRSSRPRTRTTPPSADFAHQPAGTYDDEMLNAHFTCGDGRCNENIALSTIHQIFHSEHDRLVDDIKNVLTTTRRSPMSRALPDWQQPTAGVSAYGWNGERLFQAARFVTEMEYQHLVFEEFARKIQPAVRPFHVYNPDINPAIPAEFAHAVYRFGHSMLDDDVARTNIDP